MIFDLVSGTTMSSLPNEMPALNARSEAERHDAVAEDHRLLLTAVAVDGIDQPGDRLLGQKLVDQIELDVGLPRQN
jgi:hypothetical protein